MVKPTYFRVFTPLVVIAAGAVLAMVLLLLGAAKPALADAGWAPTIDYPANNSEFADGNVYFEGYGPPGGSVDLFEVKDEGNNKVGYSQVSECQYLGTPLYNQYCWSVSLTGVADGTHTYYAVAYDENGNASDPSNSVTVVVDRSIPPTVNNIFNPSYDGQTTTGPVAWIGAYFSKTMNPNTLTSSTFTLVKHESDGSTTPVDGTVSWSIYGAEHRFAHLGFPSYLEGNTKYTATIKGGPEGIKDEFGIPLAEDYVWSFTTATWPTVTSVSPSNGATQVPANANITATFSKDMKWYWLMWPKTDCTGCIQRFTLVKEGSTTPVDATVIYGAGSTATLDPTVNLQENTKYTATVKGQPDGVEDVWSNPLAEDKIWSFTTGDATPPEDVSPPETIIDSGPSGPTSDSTPTFTFSGSDDVTTTANLKYQYRLDGGPWSTPASTTTANLTSLSDGAHLFEVRAVDEAANEDGSPAQQSFTVDTSVPETTITSGS